jgi:hypothetical protein
MARAEPDTTLGTGAVAERTPRPMRRAADFRDSSLAASAIIGRRGA